MLKEEKEAFKQQIIEHCKHPIAWGELCDRIELSQAEVTMLVWRLVQDQKIESEVRNNNIYYRIL